jgi:outer membrane lipopolysaccharide assembly protein LptE/RlpB
MDRLILTHAPGRNPLAIELRDTLRANRVSVVEFNPDDLNLVVSDEVQERRAISFNTRAGAGQYELTLTVQAALYQDQMLLAGPEDFSATTTFYEDTANISGSNSGLEFALTDLRKELAASMVHRLRAVGP